MRVVAWPAEGDNPYLQDLYSRIQKLDPEVEVRGLDVARSWRESSDIVHVHWPEAAIQATSYTHALSKGAMVALTLMIHKLRGSSLIWTCHNLRGHERTHPRMERVFRAIFDRLVDGVIHLSEASANSDELPDRLRQASKTVVSHGLITSITDNPPTRGEALARFDLDPELPILAFVGMIRPYKNVPSLISAFGEMTEPAHLVVGGKPVDEKMRDEIHQAAAGLDHVTLLDRWLLDEEVTAIVRAADAVVLAYRDVHNSGVAMMSAGLHRPVVVNPVGSLAEFADTLGPDWVFPLSDDISGASLDKIVKWATMDRPMPPDLSEFDPNTSAARTLDFFRQFG